MAHSIVCGQQEQVDEENRAASAYVLAGIDSGGQITLSLIVLGKPEVERKALLESHFQCVKDDNLENATTCRLADRIPADGKQHELALAPLYSDLRSMGIEEIHFMWSSHKRAKVSSTNWDTLPGSMVFDGSTSKELPSPLKIEMRSAAASGLLLLAAILVPMLFALWLRRSQHGNLAWLNLLVQATWLFWFSAINPSDWLSSSANLWIDLPLHSLFCAVPPLAAVCVVILLLSPVKESILHIILSNAQIMVPIAVLIGGFGLSEGSWMLAMLLAYISYHWLGILLQRHSRAQIIEVVAGEWFDQIQRLSASAGLKLQRLLLHRSAASAAVNAFAIPGNVVMLSEDLLKRMPGRELNAIVAHEIAHLLRHDGVVQMLSWVSFYPLQALVVAPLLPDEFRSLPITAPIGLFLFSQLSQFHEYRADAFAAKLTDDPEGTIAALGRLGSIAGGGLRWGRFAGLLLSHPSMERRALSIARRFQISNARALEILHQPQVLYDAPGTEPSIPLPLEQTDTTVESVFTRPETEFFAKQVAWIRDIVVLAFFAALAWASAVWVPAQIHRKWIFLGAVLAIPIAAALANRAADAWEFRQYAQWASELRHSLQPHPDARFVALRPGSQIRDLAGFLDWDVGFLSLDESRLSFTGQRIRFEIPASSIWQVERHSAQFLWQRLDAVHVQSSIGAFSMRNPVARNSCQQLLADLENWWSHANSGPADPAAPNLFPSLDPPVMPLNCLLYIAWKLIKLSILGSLLFFLLNIPILYTLIALLAPIAWLVAALPDFWRLLFSKWSRTRFYPRVAARFPSESNLAQFGNSGSSEVLN